MLIIVEAKSYRGEAELSIFFMISFSSHFSSERSTIVKNGVTRVAWRVRRSENEKCDANFDVCLYVLIRSHSMPVTFIYSAFMLQALQALQFSCGTMRAQHGKIVQNYCNTKEGEIYFNVLSSEKRHC